MQSVFRPLAYAFLGVALSACGNLFSNGSSVDGNFAPNANNGSAISLAGEVTGTAAAAVVSNAVADNTAGAIVRRDSNGNFSAGTISADLDGNAKTATTADSATNADHATTADSATTATTAASAASFTGSLSGEVTGTQGATVVSNAVSTNTAGAIVRRDASGDFDARNITATNFIGFLVGNISGSAASFTGSLAGDVTGTQGAVTVSSVGGLAAATVAAGAQLASSATNANTANTIVRRDASGNFSAGTITASLNGNATGFTGSLAGDVTGTQGATVISNLAVSKLAPGADGQVLTTSSGVAGWADGVAQAGFALGTQGANLASASTVTFGADGDFFVITGNVDIDHFAAKSAGNRVTTLFTGTPLLVNESGVGSGPLLLLAGDGNYRVAAGDVFEFLYDGTDWREIRRQVSGESRVHATRDAAQTLNGTPATVVYADEQADTQGEFDAGTGVFTAAQRGAYQVTALLTVDSPWSDGESCVLSLVHNGATTLFTAETVMVGSAAVCVVSVTATVGLAAGDTLEARGSVNAAGTNDTTAAAANPRNYLTVTRLR